MLVVLDTSVLHSNYYLDSPNFSVLQWAVNHNEIQLIIPEIVLDEFKNHYIKDITKAKKSFDRASRKIKQLTKIDVGLDFSKENIAEQIEKYENKLNRRIKELKVQVPSYSTVEHAGIVSRALASKKPFSGGKKGYRDTLLWEAVSHLVRSTKDKVFFITNNSNDFCDRNNDRNNALHGDLLQDIIGHENKLEICLEISDFTERYIRPKMIKLSETKEQISDGTYEHFNINEWIQQNENDIIEQLEYDKSNFASCIDVDEAEIYNFAINAFDFLGKIKVSQVLEITSSVILASIGCYGGTTFIFDTYDVALYMQTTEHLDCETSHFGDESSVTISCYAILPVVIEITFNIDDNSVEFFSADFADCFGWYPHCYYPVLYDSSENCEQCGESLTS